MHASAVHRYILHGDKSDPVSPSFCNKKKYVDNLEEKHPGYLHELFCHSQRVYGSTATYSELAEAMNQKSAAPGETRTTISIHRKQLSA